MKIDRRIGSLLLAVPFAASAQVVERADKVAVEQAPSRWGLGLAGVYRDSEYAGEGGRTRLVPNISYDGERFYFRGAAFGYRFVKREDFELRSFVAARLDGFDRDDLGIEALARRGIDRSLLEDRDDSADFGIGATWKGAAGTLDLELKADVTGTSDGYELAADYRYPLQFGRTSIVPAVGVLRLSADMADYYYGTLDREVARGVTDYRPGAVTVPRVGVGLVRPFARHWLLIGNLEYRVLPDELQDSPLVEEDTDGVGSFFLGISRRF
jgi:outer membrane protein